MNSHRPGLITTMAIVIVLFVGSTYTYIKHSRNAPALQPAAAMSALAIPAVSSSDSQSIAKAGAQRTEIAQLEHEIAQVRATIAPLQTANAPLHATWAAQGLSEQQGMATMVADATRLAGELARAQATATASAVVAPRTLPITSPAPAPAATLAPSPRTGTTLYQADWSRGLSGWSGASDWTVAGGVLLNDGTSNPTSLVLAPYLPSVGDYAIEAVIQSTGHQYSNSGFGLAARWSNGAGYRASVIEEGRIFFEAGDLRPNETGVSSPYRHLGASHRYRFEVRGSRLALSVDGQLVIQMNDERYRGNGRVGLFVWKSQIKVSEFQVLPL